MERLDLVAKRQPVSGDSEAVDIFNEQVIAGSQVSILVERLQASAPEPLLGTVAVNRFWS